MRALFLALLLLIPSPDVSRADEANGESKAPAQEPQLGLDRLLRPRVVSPGEHEIHGGKDRTAWQEEFAGLRKDISDLESRITTNQSRLREIQPHEWGFAPVGGGEPSDPEVLKLRAELRRDRQSLETAHQRLRDLEVEASLAGVPSSWWEPEPEP